MKYAFADFLKASAGISTLFGDRVFPRRLDNVPVLPALVVWKISEQRLSAHSGSVQLNRTLLQVDVFASTDYEVSQGKQAIVAVVQNYTGLMGAKTVESCFVENDFDGVDDYEPRLNEYRGTLEIVITWQG